MSRSVVCRRVWIDSYFFIVCAGYLGDLIRPRNRLGLLRFMIYVVQTSRRSHLKFAMSWSIGESSEACRLKVPQFLQATHGKEPEATKAAKKGQRIPRHTNNLIAVVTLRGRTSPMEPKCRTITIMM
jgi:hypothetical protein